MYTYLFLELSSASLAGDAARFVKESVVGWMPQSIFPQYSPDVHAKHEHHPVHVTCYACQSSTDPLLIWCHSLTHRKVITVAV